MAPNFAHADFLKRNLKQMAYHSTFVMMDFMTTNRYNNYQYGKYKNRMTIVKLLKNDWTIRSKFKTAYKIKKYQSKNTEKYKKKLKKANRRLKEWLRDLKVKARTLILRHDYLDEELTHLEWVANTMTVDELANLLIKLNE